MNQPSLITTLETTFTPAQCAMFTEYDQIIKAGEHFEPGENAMAYSIYCMMRDTMREQMLAQHMNGPYLSVQNNPNFSFHLYTSTHTMNSAYLHGPAIPLAHAPGFYTAYPPAPELLPYPHGHTPKPRSKRNNWKGKWDYQGLKTDRKLYMGKKKGWGEDITVTKTTRAPGTRQHMAPAIDPYMDHLHAHTMADAFNHTNTLDMSMVGSALPHTSTYSFANQGTSWGEPLTIPNTPRTPSPTLTATTNETTRQDMCMVAPVKFPKAAAQVAMLNSINTMSGLSTSVTGTQSPLDITVTVTTNPNITKESTIGGSKDTSEPKEDRDTEMATANKANEDTTMNMNQGMEASSVVAREVMGQEGNRAIEVDESEESQEEMS
ncbi:hypothetical protein FRC11_010406, partial [Ceratobasidium sp. 423]